MERIANIGLMLLAIAIAGMFWNVGYLLQPDLGLIEDPLYPVAGQKEVVRSLFWATGLSLFVAIVSLTGVIWRKPASVITQAGSFALFTIVCFVLWKFSIFFYPSLCEVSWC